MKRAYYERVRETGSISVFEPKSVIYPPHFHMSLEVFILREGKCIVSSNGKKYVMESGSVAFFAPYDTHAYLTQDFPGTDEKNTVVIIPPAFFDSHLAGFDKQSPVEAVVTDLELCRKLSTIAHDYLADPNAPKEVLNAAIGLFLAYIKTSFTFGKGKDSGENTLIRELLTYVLAHYRERLTLGSIASAIGYSSEHLSRVFHSYFGIRINDHINLLRLSYLEEKRKLHPDAKIIDLIYDAGFGGIQTYYRAKAALKE